MFRSEEMALCQIFIQPEAAYATVSELGETGIVQFRDLNSSNTAYNRRFIAEVRLCDEMERKLRYFQYVLNNEKISIRESSHSETRISLNPREVMELEVSIDTDDYRIREPSRNFKELKSRYSELSENILVLEKSGDLFNWDHNVSAPPSPTLSARSDSDLPMQDSGFLTGIIQRQRKATFERMIWRISHGYTFFRSLDLDDDQLSDKSIFVLYYQGTVIHSHILTICRGFRAKTYYYPSDVKDRLILRNSLERQQIDLKTIIDETEAHRRNILENIADNLMRRRVIVTKMKAVYHILNYFNLDMSSERFIGECWIPTKCITDVNQLLQENSSMCVVRSFMNVIDTTIIPPTYYKVNKFTEGFQSLIDTYGCCSYREVNPAYLSIITFPFLFAVMFGDIGHGLILALFALYTIRNEKRFESDKTDNEIWNLFFFGRYIILLMGLFSIYTGFIYNDVFSKSLNLFGSGWRIDHNTSRISTDYVVLDPARELHFTYTAGMDPVWQLAHNKILFTNSYKMKLSIIIGVTHMIIGICMSVFNHVHFQKKVNILIEFIPRMVFLLSIFGYLCALLLLKWSLYSASSLDPRFQPFCAPSILVMFINMVLMQKPQKPNQNCSTTIFDEQFVLQRFLIVLAIICIPFMLLAEPMIVLYRKKRRDMIAFLRNLRLNRGRGIEHASEIAPLLPGTQADIDNGDTISRSDPHGGTSYSLSDTFILQAIHTIEFVLSTVSHTASYLRLWALSLAHSQLSEVLWSRLISGPSHMRGPLAGVFLWGAFAGWAALTVTVLVLMEGLSAFLHTLRLHWVEYMSKFYTGEGYNFQPFSFRHILENNY